MESEILILPRSFYIRDTLIVARELLGKIFIRKIRGKVLSGRIVETEAYKSSVDPAAHGYGGKTARNEVMFGPPGYAYVYFTYGMHYCLNFVTEPEGVAAAVLIRALEPLEGFETMISNRGTDIITNLCSGPAKLTQAFGINKSQNGHSLLSPAMYVTYGDNEDFETGVSRRIGIKQATEYPWRFFIKDSRFLSRKEK